MYKTHRFVLRKNTITKERKKNRPMMDTITIAMEVAGVFQSYCQLRKKIHRQTSPPPKHNHHPHFHTFPSTTSVPFSPFLPMVYKISFEMKHSLFKSSNDQLLSKHENKIPCIVVFNRIIRCFSQIKTR